MNCVKLISFVVSMFLLMGCLENKGGSEEPVVAKSSEIVKLPYFNSALFTPEWEKGTHKIPNFAFVNQEGDEVTNETFKGKMSRYLS